MIEGEGVGVGARAGAETSPKSGLREPSIVEPGSLEVSSFCVIALLEMESLSGSLKAAELCGKYF